MDKTCSAGQPCQHRFMGTGTIGYGCNYLGYCDFQLPRDSRPLLPPLYPPTLPDPSFPIDPTLPINSTDGE